MDILIEIDRRVKKINEMKPFEGFYLQHIRQYYKNQTTYSSNAIEGNTYSLEETKVTFEDGITIGGHPIRDFYEVEGLGKAYDYMFSLIKKKDLAENEIARCHRWYSYTIPGFSGSGEYRKNEIKGSKKILAAPLEIPQKMREYVEWARKERINNHPVIFSAEAHWRFMNICPFAMGNGKIARLLMNTFLFQEKMFPVSIPVATKSDYYRSLEKNNSGDFTVYIAELELQALNDLMRLMHLA